MLTYSDTMGNLELKVYPCVKIIACRGNKSFCKMHRTWCCGRLASALIWCDLLEAWVDPRQCTGICALIMLDTLASLLAQRNILGHIGKLYKKCVAMNRGTKKVCIFHKRPQQQGAVLSLCGGYVDEPNDGDVPKFAVGAPTMGW